MGTRNYSVLAAAVAGVFVVLAIAGSVLTSRQMNRIADEHGMSSGRPGDGKPNGVQEFQNDESARGPTTTGSNTSSAVPPASR
jgi:hypothetical protein